MKALHFCWYIWPQSSCCTVSLACRMMISSQFFSLQHQVSWCIKCDSVRQADMTISFRGWRAWISAATGKKEENKRPQLRGGLSFWFLLAIIAKVCKKCGMVTMSLHLWCHVLTAGWVTDSSENAQTETTWHSWLWHLSITTNRPAATKKTLCVSVRMWLEFLLIFLMSCHGYY